MSILDDAERWLAHRGHRHNPPPDGEDEITRFLREMDKAGRLHTFSEPDFFEVGKLFGLDDDQVAAAIEQAASWIENTEEIEDDGLLEPAEWTGLGEELERGR